jgi:hypothetical protein
MALGRTRIIAYFGRKIQNVTFTDGLSTLIQSNFDKQVLIRLIRHTVKSKSSIGTIISRNMNLLYVFCGTAGVNPARR